MKRMISLILIVTGTTAFAGNVSNQTVKAFCDYEYKIIKENRVYIEGLLEHGAITQEEGFARLEIQRLALKNIDLTCVELLGQRKANQINETKWDRIAEAAAQDTDAQLKSEMGQLTDIDSETKNLIFNH